MINLAKNDEAENLVETPFIAKTKEYANRSFFAELTKFILFGVGSRKTNEYLIGVSVLCTQVNQEICSMGC